MRQSGIDIFTEVCYSSVMKLPGKKATIAILAALVIIPSASYAAATYPNKSVQKVEAPVNQAAVVKETSVTESTEPVEATQNVDTQAMAEPVTTPSTPATQPVAQTPTVLSVNEYAHKYLNMSGIANQRNTPQECLDALVSLWPDRFNEDVREHNIKALKFYERGGTNTICSTGIIEILNGFTPPYTVPISAYGRNGEFFDSPTANDYANR